MRGRTRTCPPQKWRWPAALLLPLGMRELEMKLLLMGGSQGIQISPITLLLTVSALVHMLPKIIQKVAIACDLSVPGPAMPLSSNLLIGRFATQQSSHRDPVWPRFPVVLTYLAGSTSEPLKLKAPVTTYAPNTKVERLTDHSFPTIPLLEPSLSSVLGMRVAR